MLVSVIIAGGVGERFWPLSRERNPKQCLNITSKHPLIEDTIDRLKPLIPKDRIFISTRKDLKKHIKEIVPDANFILEPMRRNTAAAIGLSCIELMKRYEDPIIFVETADHFYKDKKKYLNHIKLAYEQAKKGSIVLIGIKPRFPNTGYGYIEQGEKISRNVFRIKRFKEKPDLKHAKEFLKKGNHLWNSGLFMFKASVMLEEMKKYMPKLYKGLMEIKKSKKNKEKVFRDLESVSIDYGVMERSKKTTVLKADFFWDDVGSWKSMEDIHRKDRCGNIVMGHAVSIGSAGNIVKSKKLVALCDVNNMIIIDSGDALLICKKDSAQKVKDIEHLIRKKGLKRYL